jgi:hypothetical protein
MLSEAILTGRPVAMIPIRHSIRGQIVRLLPKFGLGRPPVPDFPRFWRYLARNGLVGPVDAPAVPKAEDSTRLAVTRVRRLLPK